MKILSGCQLDGYRRLKDKGVSLRFITDEKSSEDVMMIDQLNGMYGYLVFKAESNLTKEELEEIDKLDTELYDNPKTKAQRLRNVLYRNFEHDNKGFAEFKDYYDYSMETLIEHFKRKLPGIL